jgi:hypothetical protein
MGKITHGKPFVMIHDSMGNLFFTTHAKYRVLGRSENPERGTSSDIVGISVLMVEIGLNDVPESWGAHAMAYTPCSDSPGGLE